MNTRIGLLGGLLAVQALIVAGLLVAGGTGTGEATPRLLPFEPAQAVRLDIVADDDEVALLRDDDGWELDGGLPADDGKVGEVLEKLASASAAWPVATSAATAERFEVTEDNFQRRLTVSDADGEAATLFLGSSPGYRRVHARAEGADEVYSIDFSNYEAPADAGQWLDKTLLRPEGAVAGIDREDGWALSRGGEGAWLVDGAPADADAVDSLIRRFEDLNVLGIAGDGGEPRGSFTVRDEGGEYRLDFHFEEDEDDYSVSSSRVEGRFEVATYVAEQVLVEASDLLAGGDTDGDAMAGAGGGTDATGEAPGDTGEEEALEAGPSS